MRRLPYLSALLLMSLLILTPSAGAQDETTEEAEENTSARIIVSGNGQAVIVTVCAGNGGAITTSEATDGGIEAGAGRGVVEARAGGAIARVGGGVAEARAGGAVAKSGGGDTTTTTTTSSQQGTSSSERTENRVSTKCTVQAEMNQKTPTGFFRLSKGLHAFRMAHQGDGKFVVNLLDKDGTKVGRSLVNEKGPSRGSKAVQVPRDGIYLLQVKANGPWTIRVR